MRIEQFLFEEGVERTYAEYLLDRFPNLTLNTPDDFKTFFETRGIKLPKKRSPNDRKDPDIDSLLDAFKDFKASPDYEYVKQYIAIQRSIKIAMDAGDVETAKILLENVDQTQINPFYNFIVRKIFSGSETGKLPSEIFEEYFETILNAPPDINLIPDVIRDNFGRLISNQNYFINTGSIKLEIFDERFTVKTFDYVIPNEFVQLEAAKNAERTILSKADDIENLRKLSPEEQDFIQNLRNVISEDTSSLEMAKDRLQKLEKQIEDLTELLDTKEQDNNNLQIIIDELASQAAILADEVASKDDAISELSAAIDSTISDLQDQVSQQLTNTADAFDALSEKLDKQAEKQLETFNKLADAFAPEDDPKPSDDNPAKDDIGEVSKEWENLTVIPIAKYDMFVTILDEIGIKNKPSKYEYVYVPPSNKNKYNPSEEIRQHLNWNKKYKTDFKKVMVKITDKEKVKKILETTRLILKDPSCLENKGLYDTVSDSILAWADDYGGSRGVGFPFVKKAALEVGADNDWNFSNEKDPPRNEARAAARAIVKKLTRETNQLLNILQFLSEIKTEGNW